MDISLNESMSILVESVTVVAMMELYSRFKSKMKFIMNYFATSSLHQMV